MSICSIIDLDSILSHMDLYLDRDRHLLICSRPECGFALSVRSSQITAHLRDKHDVPVNVRRDLTRYLRQNYHGYLRDPTDAIPSADGSDVRLPLRLFEGFACRTCTYRTVNIQCLGRHVTHTHLHGRSATRKNLEGTFDCVFLQAWTYSGRGKEQRYWIVKKNGTTIRDTHEAYHHIQAVCEREETYSATIGSTGFTGSVPQTPTISMTRPWLERTQWATTYLASTM